MVRIIVVVILLSVFLGINAGIIRDKPQAHNVTRLEKRSPMMKKKVRFFFDICDEATYKTVKLFDFVYEQNCFPPGWNQFLNSQEVKTVISKISNNLQGEAADHQIEPPMHKMFEAFKVQSSQWDRGRDGVKVVILGQDPVPEQNKATGLAFSLKPGVNPRDGVPTVFNMLVELKLEGMDVGLLTGDLSPWVKEGVLLLNAALTVRQGTSQKNAGSHLKWWRKFTQLLVQHISKSGRPTAWILWGDKAKAFAKKKPEWIDTKKHFIKAGGHPSPQGPDAGIRFFGRNYFKCANEFLDKKGRGAVNWGLFPFTLVKSPPEECKADGL